MTCFDNLLAVYLALLTTASTAKRSSSSSLPIGFVQRTQSTKKNLYYDLRLGEGNRHSLLLLNTLLDNHDGHDDEKQLQHQPKHRQWRPFVSSLNNKQGRRYNNMNHSFSRSLFTSTTKRSVSLSNNNEQGKHKAVIESNKHEMMSLIVWVATMSSFLLINFFGKQPWPKLLIFSLEFKHWSLVHALCGMLFSGTIILSTLIEWLVVSLKKSSILKFWFTTVPQLDALVVLPALTGTVISGVAQSCHLYGKFSEAPKHITGTIHGLVAFGLWWAITDVTTQHCTKQVVKNLQDETQEKSPVELPPVLRIRRISNVISCLLVIALYAIMILKPGY